MSNRTYKVVAGLADGSEQILFTQKFSVPAEWGRGNGSAAPAYAEPYLTGVMSVHGPENSQTIWVGLRWNGYMVAAVHNPWHAGAGFAGITVSTGPGPVAEIKTRSYAGNPNRNADLAAVDFYDRVEVANLENEACTVTLFVDGVEVDRAEIEPRPVCATCGTTTVYSNFGTDTDNCQECEWGAAVKANPAEFDCGLEVAPAPAANPGLDLPNPNPAICPSCDSPDATRLSNGAIGCEVCGYLEQTQTLAGFDSAALERAATHFGPMAHSEPETALRLLSELERPVWDSAAPVWDTAELIADSGPVPAPAPADSLIPAPAPAELIPALQRLLREYGFDTLEDFAASGCYVCSGCGSVNSDIAALWCDCPGSGTESEPARIRVGLN